jgi:hypothetical protein
MPAPIGHPASASLISARPAVLVVGDRQIPIDEWPLARSVEERRSVEAGKPNANLLVIEPKKRSGAIGAVPIVLTLVSGALPGVIANALQVPFPLWLSMSLVLGVLVIALLLVRVHLSSLQWIRFDREAGQLVIERRVGFRREPRVDRSYPLESIRAVQLLFTGRHSVTEPQGAGDQQTVSYREFCGYELNLILDDPKVPRLNLFSFTDWEWIRRTGQAIGEFLAVPVIDKLYHGG